MKKLLILLLGFIQMGCGNGVNYKTTALYQAEASSLTVNLIATGHIVDGHDLDENGIVEGYISSPKLSDTIYFQANEYNVLALSSKTESIKISNPRFMDSSLIHFFDRIDYTDYDAEELKEFGKVIHAAAYGPKGTYIDGQPDLIKVVTVDFETNRGYEKRNN